MEGAERYTVTDATVGAWQERLIALSHDLHAEPEIAFAEHASAAKLAALAVDAGFKVRQGVCDLPTAFTAAYGEGDLTIGLCAEYDALPGIGHGCGHNIIAAAAAGAAVALKEVADRYGFRVKLLGTPAEESGGGKQLMLERGAFDDVTVALMAHPGAADLAGPHDSTQACARFEVTYRGRPAHAAGAPWNGVNAADAAVIAQVAIGLLRQQTPPAFRIAGIVTSGGDQTNIIPERTTMAYEVRTADAAQLTTLYQRVRDCFAAGALATGAQVEFRRTEPDYLDLRNDPWLIGRYASHLSAFGRIAAHLPPGAGSSSTDMGNISHVLPSIHPMIAIHGAGAMPHTHEFAAQAISPAADETLLDAARLLARTGLDLARDPARRAAYVDQRRTRP